MSELPSAELPATAPASEGTAEPAKSLTHALLALINVSYIGGMGPPYVVALARSMHVVFEELKIPAKIVLLANNAQVNPAKKAYRIIAREYRDRAHLMPVSGLFYSNDMPFSHQPLSIQVAGDDLWKGEPGVENEVGMMMTKKGGLMDHMQMDPDTLVLGETLEDASAMMDLASIYLGVVKAPLRIISWNDPMTYDAKALAGFIPDKLRQSLLSHEIESSWTVVT